MADLFKVARFDPSHEEDAEKENESRKEQVSQLLQCFGSGSLWSGSGSDFFFKSVSGSGKNPDQIRINPGPYPLKNVIKCIEGFCENL